MQAPALPENEEQRLQSLKALKILDTPAEERYDRLTRIACRLMDVPIALVSMVDSNRQWFKSKQGLSASGSSRDVSFCGHAILGEGIFVVEDTWKDQRFVDNPLVANEPHVRFYAGFPLKNVDGQKLGTLCIMDTKPRSLSQDDIDIFQDLTHMVEQEIAAVQMATLDELTRIPNRRGFIALAQNSLNFCARQNLPATLAFFDLNKFKPINDKFGHAEGDLALKAFAKVMRDSFRDADVYGRLGGDEFVVLLSGANMSEAMYIIDRFKVDIEIYNKEANRGYDITFCEGVITKERTQNVSIDMLMKKADKLMYEMKRQGGVNR